MCAFPVFINKLRLEDKHITFTLPNHVENNLSAKESADLIADHFSLISQEYEPINCDNFPPKIRQALEQPRLAEVPTLEDYQVYEKISKAKSLTPQSRVTFRRE